MEKTGPCKYGLNQRNFLLAPLAACFVPHSQNDCAIAPKILAAPIGVVWLHAGLGWVPTNVFFSSEAAFLSLAHSTAKGYYATGVLGSAAI